MLVINILPPEKNVETSPFVVRDGQLPLIAAHRGGSANNPENTMLAFREAVNTIGVDIIESDLYLTKDGHLVYNHNAYVDETCNINGDLSLEEVVALCENEENRHYICDMTLAELQAYNFGYYFVSYELGVEIPLDNRWLINRAHRRNVAVQYWTINDADDMRHLIELGCDCIMTDDPLLLKSVLEEYR